MFTVIAWYIVILAVFCTIVPLFTRLKTPNEAKTVIIGFIFQCIPMFLLAGHSLGWF
jgi:uncharacterized membrane protein